MDDSWKNDPRLKTMDKEKLELLTRFAEQAGPHDPSGHGAARNRRTGADVIEFCDLTALDFRKIFLSLQEDRICLGKL